jgi:membrane protease YdiL (CAAX protease family)
LLFYVIYRSRESWSRYGVVRPAWWDVPATLILWVTVFFGLGAMYALILAYLPGTGQSLLDSQTSEAAKPAFPQGALEHAVLVLGCLSTGLTEELAFRGYLLPRLDRLLRGTGTSLVLTSVLFGVVHLHQGTGSAVTAGFFGLFYGAAFCALGRIWPLALAHAFHNLIVELQLLSG